MNRLYRNYGIIISAAGLLCLGLSFASLPEQLVGPFFTWRDVSFFFLLGLLLNSMLCRLPGLGPHRAMTFLAPLFFLGPVITILLAASIGLIIWAFCLVGPLRDKSSLCPEPGTKHFAYFLGNAQTWLALAGAGAIFHLLGGRLGQIDVPFGLLAPLAAALGLFFGEMLLEELARALQRGLPFIASLRNGFLRTLPVDASLAGLGLLLALLYQQREALLNIAGGEISRPLGIAFIVLIVLIPCWLLYYSYRLQLEMRQAYENTLRTLSGLVEARLSHRPLQGEEWLGSLTSQRGEKLRQVAAYAVAIAAGIGTAGKHGVLIKGGVALENIGRIRAAAFDKTGTLTMGKPVVTDIVALKGDPESVLCLAATIERRSEHPIARAIVARAEAGRIQCLEPTDFSAVAGYGAVAQVQGRKIYVGKPGLFKRMGIEVESLRPLLDLRDAGNTVMLVGTDEGLEGIIALRDEVRPQAREILRQLSKLGIKTAMLTGDNDVSAKAVAEAVGIASVHADLKPEDKMLVLKELKQKYERVAMVGDGINDAPALASASVGVAMGAAGSDAAIEAADLALMSDDLSKLVFAVRIGRKARRVSQQNIVFSLVVLAVLIPAAVFGAISITVAVLAHEASELLAVANGLRAGRP